MTVRIITADVFAGLAQLPDESVHCCISSPPYWGLRDYGVPGQLGLEPTLGEHVDRMVEVFREVRRVLRPDGTLWLNYGDCYATSINGRSAADTKAIGEDDRTFRDKPFSTVGPIYDASGGPKGGGYRGNNRHNSQATPNGRICAGGVLKPKDLCGVPWRIAFALQDDGWWLRQDIIWAKPNPMPESIKDRCTKAHEYLFLLAKGQSYYFDAEAIKEPSVYVGIAGMDESGFKDPCQYAGKNGRVGKNGRIPRPKVAGWQEGALGHGHSTLDHNCWQRPVPAARAENERDRKGCPNAPRGRKAGNKSHKYVEAYEASDTEEHRTKAGLLKIAETAYATRNKRSVWEVATDPFDGEFCTSCRRYFDGEAKRKLRVLELEDGTKCRYCKCGRHDAWLSHFATFPHDLIEPCIKAGCPEGGLVLDPFGGSGTTGLVADRLHRHAILIEINPDYAEMSKLRLQGDAPLLMKVSA